MSSTHNTTQRAKTAGQAKPSNKQGKQKKGKKTKKTLKEVKDMPESAPVVKTRTAVDPSKPPIVHQQTADTR